MFVLEDRVYSRRGAPEPDWHTDGNASSKCVDLDGVKVNASVAITDYKQTNSGFYFDLIEFFGTQYRIYRVTIASNNTLLPLQELVAANSISSLFPTICLTKKQWGFGYLIVVIAIVLIAIMAVIAITIFYFCVVRKRGFADLRVPPKEPEEKIQLRRMRKLPSIDESESHVSMRSSEGSDSGISLQESRDSAANVSKTEPTDVQSAARKPVFEPPFEATHVKGGAPDQPYAGPPVAQPSAESTVNEPPIAKSRVVFGAKDQPYVRPPVEEPEIVRKRVGD